MPKKVIEKYVFFLLPILAIPSSPRSLDSINKKKLCSVRSRRVPALGQAAPIALASLSHNKGPNPGLLA